MGLQDLGIIERLGPFFCVVVTLGNMMLGIIHVNQADHRLHLGLSL